LESFKFSNDPDLASKVRDIVGLYLNPPDRPIILRVDEKSQVQALDPAFCRTGRSRRKRNRRMRATHRDQEFLGTRM
jgi:hypothetical protein